MPSSDLNDNSKRRRKIRKAETKSGAPTDAAATRRETFFSQEMGGETSFPRTWRFLFTFLKYETEYEVANWLESAQPEKLGFATVPFVYKQYYLAEHAYNNFVSVWSWHTHGVYTLTTTSLNTLQFWQHASVIT